MRAKRQSHIDSSSYTNYMNTAKQKKMASKQISQNKFTHTSRSQSSKGGNPNHGHGQHIKTRQCRTQDEWIHHEAAYIQLECKRQV